jgi:hypothetical protein
VRFFFGYVDELAKNLPEKITDTPSDTTTGTPPSILPTFTMTLLELFKNK